MTPEEFDDWLNQPESLTPEEAQKAYDETVPIPLSEERIQEIVDYVLVVVERERIQDVSAWIDRLMAEPDEPIIINPPATFSQE